ncbi:unnamed protein product [Sphagnum troendelagicum]
MAVGRRATDNRAQDDITMMQTVTLVVMSSAPELRSDGGTIRLARDIYGKRQRDKRRATAWCCVATNRVAAALHFTLMRHCSSRCCGAVTHVTATLRRSKLRRCDIATCIVAALQPALLRHCSSCGCVAVVLQLAWLCCCGAAHGFNGVAL